MKVLGKDVLAQLDTVEPDYNSADALREFLDPNAQASIAGCLARLAQLQQGLNSLDVDALSSVDAPEISDNLVNALGGVFEGIGYMEQSLRESLKLLDNLGISIDYQLAK